MNRQFKLTLLRCGRCRLAIASSPRTRQRHPFMCTYIVCRMLACNERKKTTLNSLLNEQWNPFVNYYSLFGKVPHDWILGRFLMRVSPWGGRKQEKKGGKSGKIIVRDPKRSCEKPSVEAFQSLCKWYQRHGETFSSFALDSFANTKSIICQEWNMINANKSHSTKKLITPNYYVTSAFCALFL